MPHVPRWSSGRRFLHGSIRHRTPSRSRDSAAPLGQGAHQWSRAAGTRANTVGRQSCSPSMSWPRFRFSRRWVSKSWSSSPAPLRTSTSSPGSTWPTRTKLVNGGEQVIGVRRPGDLGGEIPMTLGTPLPASMRAVEPTRVLKLTVEDYHTLAAMAPAVSAAVGAAALERMEMLKSATAQPIEPAMFVIGPRVDPGVHGCDSFLHRNQIRYERLDPDDPRAVTRTGGDAAVAAPFPVVMLRDGTQLIAPTMRVVATVAGLTVAPGRSQYDVVIVGGGPAG